LIVYSDYWRIDPFFCQKESNLSCYNAHSHDGNYPVTKHKCPVESILFIKDDVPPIADWIFFARVRFRSKQMVPVFSSVESIDTTACPSGLSCLPISIVADFAILASRTLRAMSEAVLLIIP